MIRYLGGEEVDSDGGDEGWCCSASTVSGVRGDDGGEGEDWVQEVVLTGSGSSSLDSRTGDGGLLKIKCGCEGEG
jgi:hypothetical protein